MIELYWAVLFGLQSKNVGNSKEEEPIADDLLWQIVGFCLVLLLARKEATKVSVCHVSDSGKD